MTASAWSPNPNTVTQANAQGTLKQELQVGSLGQQIFTLTTFAFAPNTGSLLVYKNGLLLNRNVDYLETSGTQIILTIGTVAGDKILLVGFVGVVGTVAADAVLRADLAAVGGAANVGTQDPVYATPYLQTVSNIVNGLEVSALRFVPTAKHTGIRQGTNTDFLQAYFQTACDAGVKSLFIPGGRYNVNGATTKTTTGSFRLCGEGIGITTILQAADVNTFNLINNVGGSGQFVVENMSLVPQIAMVAGIALNIQNNGALPALKVSNVFIGSPALYEFKYGVKTTNCTEAIFDHVMMYGLGATNFVAWQLNATGAATTPKWLACSVYNALYGTEIKNTTSPGIEGAQFYGCDFVGVATGVRYNNSFGPTYFPPQLLWHGGHINASSRNFDLTNVAQVSISDALLYNSGLGPFINLDTCPGFSIKDNQFYAVGGNAAGIIVSTAASPLNGGIISGNNFVLNAADCISWNTGNIAGIIKNTRITNNIKTSGAQTFSVAAGSTLDPSIILKDNTLDTADISAAIAVSGVTLSLLGVRSDFVLVSAPGAPVTVTSLTSRREGETIVLKCDSPNLTIQHNGTNPNGFLLKAGVNFNFSIGATITLVKANGGYWTQI